MEINNENNVMSLLPELQGEEMIFVQELIRGLSKEKARLFATVYKSRRKEPQLIMITALLGFFIAAGVHRFIVGQIGMGLLYLFTGGFCFVGTIIDLINYQKIAFEYNSKIAEEVKATV